MPASIAMLRMRAPSKPFRANAVIASSMIRLLTSSGRRVVFVFWTELAFFLGTLLFPNYDLGLSEASNLKDAFRLDTRDLPGALKTIDRRSLTLHGDLSIERLG